jgi:hypothetical protein
MASASLVTATSSLSSGKTCFAQDALVGDDVPVDVEADDFFQSGLIGHRIGLAGARDLGGILPRKQHRIVADDREPGGVAGKRFRHALIEPSRRTIKAVVRSEAITRQCDFIVGEERRHQTRAGLVGVLGNLSHQRQRNGRRRQQQILPGLQPQTYLDGDLGQPIEFDWIDRSSDFAFV